jgi:hypothetical protein
MHAVGLDSLINGTLLSALQPLDISCIIIVYVVFGIAPRLSLALIFLDNIN